MFENSISFAGGRRRVFLNFRARVWHRALETRVRNRRRLNFYASFVNDDVDEFVRSSRTSRTSGIVFFRTCGTRRRRRGRMFFDRRPRMARRQGTRFGSSGRSTFRAFLQTTFPLLRRHFDLVVVQLDYDVPRDRGAAARVTDFRRRQNDHARLHVFQVPRSRSLASRTRGFPPGFSEFLAQNFHLDTLVLGRPDLVHRRCLHRSFRRL